MTTYARVEDGEVVEVVDVRPGTPMLRTRYAPEVLATFVAVPPGHASQVAPGWRWDGSAFSLPPPPPPAPVPREVTNFQARAVLLSQPGPPPFATMFDAADAALRAEGGVAWQAWEYANHVSFDGQLVAVMAAHFGLTAEQVAALFIAASKIEA